MEKSTWKEPRLEAATLFHQSYLTGLILYLLQKKGVETAAELVFRTFRRQHLEKFVAGLDTLGLTELPDAVACAQFIYLANRVGGVGVEFMVESERKAWVRYPPPRWIYEGAALCAIPRQVPVAFMRAFHAHCGVSLGNPRLGFVCTMMTTDGQPGLEGYFNEGDRDLAENERLRFAPDEVGPVFEPSAAPPLPFAGVRLERAARNYALQYIRVALPELASMLPGEGARLGREAAILVGMQLYERAAGLVGVADRDSASFAKFLCEVLRGCGDEPVVEQVTPEMVIAVPRLRILAESDSVASEAFDAWCGLWEGALRVHHRGWQLEPLTRRDRGDDAWRWRISKVA